MKDDSSVNSSFATVRKDFKEYEFSIQSVISEEPQASFKKKKTAFVGGDSDDSEKGKKVEVRGKALPPKEREVELDESESSLPKVEYTEPMTEIQAISNISLFKEKNAKGNMYFFFRIDGEIMKITESNNNENEMFTRTDYAQIDIQVEDFNSDANPISGKDDLQDIIPILMTFAEFLKLFTKICSVMHEQVSSILKPIDFDTYLVFILQTVRKVSLQAATKQSLQQMIRSITYQELEDNIQNYINYVLEQFYLPIPEKCPSHLPVYRILETIIPDMRIVTHDMKKLGKFGDFSILTEMSEIITKINKELFLSFEEQELAINDKPEFKTSLINKLFYLLLIQINNFFKKTYPICCNYEKDAMLNYAKEPFVLCMDCKAIICHRCFKHHRSHNYFDFACTIRKKFANVHSSLHRFLNYKKGDSSSFGKISSINIDYAEDHILFCILKGLDSICDNYIMSYMKTCSFHNESGHITVLHFIDVFLLEFLYKAVFPFKHNPQFLEYDLQLKSAEDRTNLLTVLMATQAELNCKGEREDHHSKAGGDDYYGAYTLMRETKRQEEKGLKVHSLIQKIKPKVFDLDDPFSETPLNSPLDSTLPFYFDQSLTNSNFIENSLEDFEQVKANFSKLRFQIQKLKAKEKNDLLNNISGKKSTMKGITYEKSDPYCILKEKKVPLSDLIVERLNWIFQRENFAFELKWYYAYADEKEKCTKVKFIDGMGSLYQYVMCYFDEVITSASEFGTVCLGKANQSDNAPIRNVNDEPIRNNISSMK